MALLPDNRDYLKEGFTSGVNWKQDYRPGGPYRCTDKSRYPDMYARDKKNSEDWFQGFDLGLSVRDMFRERKREDILEYLHDELEKTR